MFLADLSINSSERHRTKIAFYLIRIRRYRLVAEVGVELGVSARYYIVYSELTHTRKLRHVYRTRSLIKICYVSYKYANVKFYIAIRSSSKTSENPEIFDKSPEKYTEYFWASTICSSLYFVLIVIWSKIKVGQCFFSSGAIP